jgi:CubicO group peptidase (beta-lactamase class C family)/beta-lactamase regulating signal transducer with metallopeptidase domain
MNAAAWLAIVLVKSAVVVLLAALATLAIRRRSASARHAVWGVALVSLLILPLLSAVLPAFEWAVLPSADEPVPLAPGSSADASTPNAAPGSAHATTELPSAAASASSTAPAPLPLSLDRSAEAIRPPEPTTWQQRVQSAWAARDRVSGYFLLAWALGTLWVLLRLVLGVVSARRLVGRAEPLRGDWSQLLDELTTKLAVTSRVALRLSDEVSVPMVCGYRESVIVLPREADSWPEERRRAFLMHELAHVQRRDCLMQAAASVARAVYWPQPLVAWAVARLRLEAEHACDDHVVTQGGSAPEYAHHLLEAARTLQPMPAAGGFAGIAERSHLERRLLALLDKGLQRGAVTPKTLLAGAALGIAVTVAVSVLQPVARAAALQILAAHAAGPAGGAHGDYGFWTVPLEANSGKTHGTPINLNLAPVPGTHMQTEDGRLLAYTSNGSGRDEIWVKDFKTGRAAAMTHTPKDSARTIATPVLSPDGRTVYYQVTEDLKEYVYSVPTAGGEPKRICECGWPTDVSPDGTTLLVQDEGSIMGTPGNPGDRVYAVDLATGRKTKILSHQDWTFWRIHFSPDGKWLSFHVGLRGPGTPMGVGDTVHEIVAPYRGAAAIGEREWIKITDGKAYSDASRWSPDGNLMYYVSDRDGARCIWAQRLEPATKKPVGEPISVLHIHSPRHSLSNLGANAEFPLGWLDISVSRDKLIFSLGTPPKATWADVIAPGPVPPPSVVATAPPVPPLTGPAALKVPDTPAGHAFSAWLDSFNSGDRELMKRFHETAPTLGGDVDDDLHFRKMTGGFNFIRVEQSERTRITGLVEERNSDVVARFEMIVDPTEPHPLTKALLQAIPRPDGLPSMRESEEALLSDLRSKLERDTAADLFSGTVLVAHDGKTVFSRAYGLADREKKIANTLDTRFRIGSMNKMFTAAAVMQLAEAGKLKLTDPIGKHLPDYPNAETASEVTIQQLLTHTGGLGDLFGPTYDEHRLELRTLQDYIKTFGTGAPLYEPGTRNRYSNYGFIVLGAVVEKASGQSYYDYVREHVFAPAGMTSTDSLPENEPVADRSVGYTRRDAARLSLSENPWRSNADTLPWRGTPAGGGYSTAGDLLRFASALMQNKLVSAAGTSLLTTHSSLPAADPQYGLGFQDQTNDHLRFVGHNGGAPGMNGELRIYPDTGYVVVVLSNFDPATAGRIASFIDGRMPASR